MALGCGRRCRPSPPPPPPPPWPPPPPACGWWCTAPPPRPPPPPPEDALDILDPSNHPGTLSTIFQEVWKKRGDTWAGRKGGRGSFFSRSPSSSSSSAARDPPFYSLFLFPRWIAAPERSEDRGEGGGGGGDIDGRKRRRREGGRERNREFLPVPLFFSLAPVGGLPPRPSLGSTLEGPSLTQQSEEEASLPPSLPPSARNVETIRCSFLSSFPPSISVRPTALFPRLAWRRSPPPSPPRAAMW